MANAQAAIVVVMLAISAAVWWLWARRWNRFGELWPREQIPETSWNPVAVVLAIALIWLLLIAALRPGANDVLSPMSLEQVQSSCAVRILLIAVFWSLLAGFRGRHPRDFGFTLMNWRRQIAEGLETAHASFLPVLFALFVTSPLRRSNEKNPLLQLLEHDHHLATLAWASFAAVVLAPLAEELLFRVILLGWLKTKTTSTHAIGISSVAFALIHGPLDGVALLPLALLLGSLYDRRHRYLSVVVAHAFFNLWNIALTMAGKS